jgi:cephalosporin hydroxylase
MIDVVTSTRTMAEVRDDVCAIRARHADTINAFHRVWYEQRNTWSFTFYDQRPMMKCPTDLWVYQEIITDLKPTLIVETGTAYGASALYFAHQLDRIGIGSVISIDAQPFPDLPDHDRCWFVKGSSTDPEIVEWVRQRARGQRVMVVLDSDHSMAHVLEELAIYAPLVTPGQFLVVEDTNINGRPVPIDWKGGPGPGPAVDAWLPAHPEFERDLLAERYLLTMHPDGWLRRVQ